jgi:hypothetical protein
MAIDPATRGKNIRLTREMWAEKARDAAFLRLTRGKERGHKMADFVDECTTELLKDHFVTRFETGKKGESKKRSMGDVWLKSGGIFNPINIKIRSRNSYLRSSAAGSIPTTCAL